MKPKHLHPEGRSAAAGVNEGVNDLASFWMPFTPNRDFKAHPRMLVRAEGMHYWDASGRKVLDAAAGLWCTNAGHTRKAIAEAIAAQAYELDFAPTFQFGHPKAFALAARVAALAPEGMDRVFFVNSGSEACDTALKIARAYFKAIGQGGRTRLIGREKAYHGIGFGGISVGGIAGNRRAYGPLLPDVDHLPLAYDRGVSAFSRGEPDEGAHLADALENLCALHDPSTIAAVIVEPVSGSAGVYPPPKNYLQRLRALCDKHGILLIFDEVITAFGRLGHAFAAERYGVTPDMITFAKGITNASVPLGGVIAKTAIYDAFRQGADHAIELPHGNTYSGHPLACAAGLATLDLYAREDLFTRALKMAPVLEDAVHSLKGAPRVIDIRNVGMAAAIDLEPDPKAPGRRGYRAMVHAFEDEALAVRISGDCIAFSPALIAEEHDIAQMIDGVRAVLAKLD